MPLVTVIMLCLLGIGVAIFRRNPQAFLDGPAEDGPLRLTRWSVALLAAPRHEWGQAMLGELAHIDGRARRARFAVGCVVAALVLPPWGRATAGLWAMIAVAAGGVGLYASLAVHYHLGVGDWIAVAVLLVTAAAFVLGASALLRRPSVAGPGLLGGLLLAAAFLAMEGLTFERLLTTVPSFRGHLLVTVGTPLLVGAAGTLWARDAAVGRRIARLAALSGGLILFLYETVGVAVIGGGGPYDEDGGGTLRGTISDRVAHNLVDLMLFTLLAATVGWAGAAIAGRLIRGSAAPASDPRHPDAGHPSDGQGANR